MRIDNPEHRRHIEFDASPDIEFDFTDAYLDPVQIWIGKDGYGQVRIQGFKSSFPVRKAGLEENDKPLRPIDWSELNLHYQNLVKNNK